MPGPHLFLAEPLLQDSSPHVACACRGKVLPALAAFLIGCGLAASLGGGLQHLAIQEPTTNLAGLLHSIPITRSRSPLPPSAPNRLRQQIKAQAMNLHGDEDDLFRKQIMAKATSLRENSQQALADAALSSVDPDVKEWLRQVVHQEWLRRKMSRTDTATAPGAAPEYMFAYYDDAHGVSDSGDRLP